MLQFVAINKHRIFCTTSAFQLHHYNKFNNRIVHNNKLFSTSSNTNNEGSKEKEKEKENTQYNKLFNRNKLQNQYYALRHGQSLANVAKIISSDPKISTIQHGLSDVGKEQVRVSAKQFIQDYKEEFSNGGSGGGNSGVVVYTSDFTRARETATIFVQELEAADIPLYNPNDDTDDDGSEITVPSTITKEIRLRERYFGTFNGKSDEHYQDVWDVDCINPNHTEFNVESVNSVVERTSQLVLDIDDILSQGSVSNDGRSSSSSSSSSWKVILVAHGDVLQIAQTAFQKVDGSVHRSLDHLETATVREMVLPNTDKNE